jgi:hypothetical protein
MRGLTALRRKWLLLPLLPLAGCYTYASAPLDTLSPGLQTRIRLDDDGFGRVLNEAVVNGVPPDRMDLERKGVVGRVVQLGSDNLTVELRGVGGSVFATAIPSQSIREVALRRFDLPRTIGAVLVGSAAFAVVYTGWTGGSTTGDLPPEPDQMVWRLFSIPLR